MNNAPIPTSRARDTLQRGLVVVVALVIVGCADTIQRPSATTTVVPSGSRWALPTATMRWNEYACDLITKYGSGQQGSVRVLAYVNLAINNGIVVARQQGVKPDGAAAGAAAAILAYLFPKDAALIEARLQGEIAALGPASRD